MVDVRDFIAGWIGGAAGVISSHPLDTVKVRLQTSNAFKGTFDCTIKTMQKEGAKGFFKGMSFPLASVAAYNAIVFGVYSNTSKLIAQYRYGDPSHAPSYADTAVAAMVAGSVSVVVGAPVDLYSGRQAYALWDLNSTANARLPGQPLGGLLRHTAGTFGYRIPITTVTTAHATKTEPYRGVYDCLARIYKSEGIAGFYKGGAAAMIIRDIPGYAMYFVPYVMLCNLFKSSVTGEPTAGGYILAGGLAGVVSWGFAHPMDTLKSRIQLDGHQGGGVLNRALAIYKNEGMAVFFRGIGVNALRGFPQSAALFFGYEMSMKAMSP